MILVTWTEGPDPDLPKPPALSLRQVFLEGIRLALGRHTPHLNLHKPGPVIRVAVVYIAGSTLYFYDNDSGKKLLSQVWIAFRQLSTDPANREKVVRVPFDKCAWVCLDYREFNHFTGAILQCAELLEHELPLVRV